MVIKNIVIAGGGPTGLTTCGAISEMIRQKIIDTNNIEKIYATSIGGFIGVLLCLDYNWQDDIYNFFIMRPWEKTISIESEDIMDMFNGGCYLDKLFNVIKKDIFVKDLKSYDEILLVGSGKGVASIKTIKQIGWKRKNLKKFRILSKYYNSIINKCRPHKF